MPTNPQRVGHEPPWRQAHSHRCLLEEVLDLDPLDDLAVAPSEQRLGALGMAWQEPHRPDLPHTVQCFDWAKMLPPRGLQRLGVPEGQLVILGHCRGPAVCKDCC